MRQAAYEAGMNDYVLKPFESKELQERILLVLNGTHFKKT
jgi:DNA-binding response OmpR family regulator